MLADLDQVHRVVGYYDILNLLRPEHRYFLNHQGFIKGLSGYRQTPESHRQFFYPRLKVCGRMNPMRRKQLSRSHSAHVINELQAVMAASGLGAMRMSSLVFTMPRHISDKICRLKDPTAAAWRLWKTMFRTLQSTGSDWSGIGARVNLHLWKTNEPITPHVHFHALIPDSRLMKAVGSEDRIWRRQLWHDKPFTPEQLAALKAAWRKILVRFCRRHGLGRSFGCVDIFVDWVDWGELGQGRARFMHKLNYQQRHWTEDYQYYCLEHPDAPDPPAWLQRYENRARVYGWWTDIRSLSADAPLGDREKLSPVTGKKMIYVGPVNLARLLHESGGRLGYFEMRRGRPVLGELSPDEIRHFWGLVYPGWVGPMEFAGEEILATGDIHVK